MRILNSMLPNRFPHFCANQCVFGFLPILLVQPATYKRGVPYLVVGAVVRRSYWSSRQPKREALPTLSWRCCTAILLVQPATNKRGVRYLVVERLNGDPFGPAGNQWERRPVPCREAVVRRSYWSSQQPIREAFPTVPCGRAAVRRSYWSSRQPMRDA